MHLSLLRRSPSRTRIAERRWQLAAVRAAASGSSICELAISITIVNRLGESAGVSRTSPRESGLKETAVGRTPVKACATPVGG